MHPLTEMYPKVPKCFLFGKIPNLRGLMLARGHTVKHEHKSEYFENEKHSEIK